MTPASAVLRGRPRKALRGAAHFPTLGPVEEATPDWGGPGRPACGTGNRPADPLVRESLVHYQTLGRVWSLSPQLPGDSQSGVGGGQLSEGG